MYLGGFFRFKTVNHYIKVDQLEMNSVKKKLCFKPTGIKRDIFPILTEIFQVYYF